MYVHVGKDVSINFKDVIAILDIKALKKQKKFEEVLQNLKISDNIIDVSENNKKSLIIINKKGKLLGYITNISSTTLSKRANR